MVEPKILFEDQNLIVVDKPAGLLTHAIPAGKGRVPELTLVDWLLPRYPELKKVGDNPRIRPGIVHRLDRDTSGAVLIPRTAENFIYLKSLFQASRIEKKYLALVSGSPEPASGRIDRAIGIKSGSVKRSIHSKQMRKEAITDYEIMETLSGFSLLLVRPKTGRTHQIRVHLGSIGHPVVGDRLYGPRKQPSWASRLYLHAASIRFESGSGSVLEFDSPLPEEFESACQLLRLPCS